MELSTDGFDVICEAENAADYLGWEPGRPAMRVTLSRRRQLMAPWVSAIKLIENRINDRRS